MAKKKNKKNKPEHGPDLQASQNAARQPAGAGPSPKMKRREYEREMRLLHGELVAMQEWALPAPTEREKSQMYIQRYLPHFPAAGEIVIFDRSWYNRAGVEPVMGFCTPGETGRFLELTPGVEKAMADDGILLLKYWLEVSPGEQTRRLKSRMNDPRKIISHLLSQVPYKPLTPQDITLPRRQQALTRPGVPGPRRPWTGRGWAIRRSPSPAAGDQTGSRHGLTQTVTGGPPVCWRRAGGWR